MNEIVKYHNDLSNQIVIKTLNANELNFFMAICSKMRDKNLEEITFSFEQLKELTNWTSNDNKDFIKSLENTNKKLIRLNFTFRDTNKIVQFVLFPTFTIDTNEKTLKVRVNKDFSFLLNTLTNNFTRFELENFTSLTSKYSKYLYKELMKFKSTGHCLFMIDDFREKLDIPKSYRMSHINTKVLDVCKKELSKIFKNFEIKKTKTGRNITKIDFYFILKDIVKKDKKTDDVIVVDEKKEITEQDLLKEFFKTNFKDIVYNSKIEKALEKRLKKDKLKTIESDLLQQYEELQKLDYIKNKSAFFSDCIINNKRVMTSDFTKNIKEKENKKSIELEREDIYKNKTEDDCIQTTLNLNTDDIDKVIEELETLEEYDRLAIENNAIQKKYKSSEKTIEYLMVIKESNKRDFYLLLEPCLTEELEKYKNNKKDKNYKDKTNQQNSENKKKFTSEEVKEIMLNSNKLDLKNITDTIKKKILDNVESTLNGKDKLLFQAYRQLNHEQLFELYLDEITESFNKYHSKDLVKNARVTVEVTSQEIEKKIDYILEHKDKFVKQYRDLLLSKNNKLLFGIALKNRFIKLIQENIIKI